MAYWQGKTAAAGSYSCSNFGDDTIQHLFKRGSELHGVLRMCPWRDDSTCAFSELPITTPAGIQQHTHTQATGVHLMHATPNVFQGLIGPFPLLRPGPNSVAFSPVPCCLYTTPPCRRASRTSASPILTSRTAPPAPPSPSPPSPTRRGPVRAAMVWVTSAERDGVGGRRRRIVGVDSRRR